MNNTQLSIFLDRVRVLAFPIYNEHNKSQNKDSEHFNLINKTVQMNKTVP
jgi:hypothetical protein